MLVDKIIIIPGYIIPYLIDFYPIIDINLKLINKQYTSMITDELIVKLREIDLIKIINNFNLETIVLDSLNPITLLIGSHVINKYDFINSYQDLWLKDCNTKCITTDLVTAIQVYEPQTFINSKISSNISIYKITWDQHAPTNFVPPVYDINPNNMHGGKNNNYNYNYKNKYLKYKIKYLNLKKIKSK
jgi:hypothetical protein